MNSSLNEVNEIIDNIKLFAFDMDGVLRIGQYSIEGAENIFNLIKDLGKDSLIITNECRYTSEEIKEDLVEMGINIPDNLRILTAGDMVYEYLNNKMSKISRRTYIFRYYR